MCTHFTCKHCYPGWGHTLAENKLYIQDIFQDLCYSSNSCERSNFYWIVVVSSAVESHLKLFQSEVLAVSSMFSSILCFLGFLCNGTWVKNLTIFVAFYLIFLLCRSYLFSVSIHNNLKWKAINLSSLAVVSVEIQKDYYHLKLY